MVERLVAYVGAVIGFLGLIWGLLLPTLGAGMIVVGIAIALFGLFFSEDS